MAPYVAEVLLWLFVLNLGIAFGAGLYETRIAVPLWLRFAPGSGYRWDAAAARQANVGIRFWVYVTTVPLSLLTLANLATAWWAHDPVRRWWLGAAAAALMDRVLTGVYFIPTMLELTRGEGPSGPEAVAKALRWVRLGYLRLAVTLGAWLAALRAFSLLHTHGS
jgi:hypothetical protein